MPIRECLNPDGSRAYPFTLRVDEEDFAQLDVEMKEMVHQCAGAYYEGESFFTIIVTSAEVDILMDTLLRPKIIRQLTEHLYIGADLDITRTTILDYVALHFGIEVMEKMKKDNPGLPVSWLAEDLDKLLPEGFYLKYMPAGADICFKG